MGDKTRAIVLFILFAAPVGPATATEEPGHHYTRQAAEPRAVKERALYQPVEAVYSGCQRHTVVWSGGIARRGPDRIRPRTVRSRWQGADYDRIFCSGGDPFQRKRVADQPWIR